MAGKRFRETNVVIALIQEPWTSNTGRVSGLSDTKSKIIACDWDEFCTRDVAAARVSLTTSLEMRKLNNSLLRRCGDSSTTPRETIPSYYWDMMGMPTTRCGAAATLT